MIKIMYNLQIFYFHKHKTGFFSLIPCPYLKFIFVFFFFFLMIMIKLINKNWLEGSTFNFTNFVFKLCSFNPSSIIKFYTLHRIFFGKVSTVCITVPNILKKCGNFANINHNKTLLFTK